MFSKRYPALQTHPTLGRPSLVSLSYIQAADDPHWAFYMHAHEDALEISYMLGGKGALYCDGKYYPMTAGDIVIKNPTVRHAENADPRDPIEQVCALVTGLALPGAPANCLPMQGFSPVIQDRENKPLLDALFRAILCRTIGIDAPDLPAVNSLLESALWVIWREAQTLIAERKADEHGQAMQQVRAYIDGHFAEPISLDALADSFHLSRYYLSRQFKQYTGFTINNYIVSCRIGEAQRCLIFTDERIDAIAARCGYANLSYFYTTFRKKVGCPPAEYKKRYRNLAGQANPQG
jgi:AraC-like DNA-binding protein